MNMELQCKAITALWQHSTSFPKLLQLLCSCKCWQEVRIWCQNRNLKGPRSGTSAGPTRSEGPCNYALCAAAAHAHKRANKRLLWYLPSPLTIAKLCNAVGADMQENVMHFRQPPHNAKFQTITYAQKPRPPPISNSRDAACSSLPLHAANTSMHC